MKVYVDTSVYNRLFDDQTQPRIVLETLALRLVLQLVEIEAVQLISSSVLEYENSRNPFALRQQWIKQCLQLATADQEVDEGVSEQAQVLEEEGLGAIDALHLACAESAESEYFLTCDKHLIRRYQGRLNMMNPVNFVLEMIGG